MCGTWPGESRLAAEKGGRGGVLHPVGRSGHRQGNARYYHQSGREKPVRAKLPYWLAMATAPLSELYYKAVKRKPLYTAYSIYTLRTNCHFNCSKAMKELGYRFRPAAESLADAVEWLFTNGVFRNSSTPGRLEQDQ